MGQKVHPTGFRLGISQGWDSSWSLDPTQRGHDYRHNLHMDLEVRNLITQLFASKGSYVGKIGISKNSNTGIVDINVFGYVPGEIKKYSLNGSVITTSKEELQVQLKRLIEVLNKKYVSEVFTLNCVIVKGIISDTRKKKKFWKKKFWKKGSVKRKGRFKIRSLSGSKLSNSRVTIKSDSFVNKQPNKNKSWRKTSIKSFIKSGMKEFKYLSRKSYFDSMINIIFLVFKTKQPQFLASFLARELTKTRKQRALYLHSVSVCAFFFKVMPDLKGIRIQVCGRINKTKRSRKYITQYGEIACQTILKPVEYGFDEACTSYGSMGVKVWLSY